VRQMRGSEFFALIGASTRRQSQTSARTQHQRAMDQRMPQFVEEQVGALPVHVSFLIPLGRHLIRLRWWR